MSKWESIRQNENLLLLQHGNDNVLRVLKLSYDKLPTHLKQCFTYCDLFPQDYEIEKQLLVQLWIAQGYIQSSNRDEQLEDMGDRYFEESYHGLTAHTQYGQVVEAAVRDERSMGLKSQVTHSQGQKRSRSTWVQGGSNKQLGFYGLFI